DLVFNNAPNEIKTDHHAFHVKLSPTKPDQDLSHTNRPSAPIIKDWVSDSEDEYETKAPQKVPSFVQSTEQVKYPRPSVQHVETSIPAATLKSSSPKPTSNGKRINRKACFVCKSLDHLIKDCNYHEKKMAQPTARNHAHRGNHKQYAQMTLSNPQRHVVPAAVLIQSRPVPITIVRPVTTTVPKIKAPVVNAAQGIQGKWEWKPKCPILDHVSRNTSVSMTLKRFDYNDALGRSKSDKRVIDSGCSRHMTGNMSYLFDFEELDGGYVAFGGNPKGGKISGKVILNGDSPTPARVVDGVLQPVAPTTAEQLLARKKKLKARGTLLMALPNKHQLKFNSHIDEKTLMEAIEKSTESLDQIHDRLQKLISQLEILGVSLSQEDINLKFLRSLPSDRRTHTLIWRRTNLRANGPTSMGFDMSKVECYNCHRKGHFVRVCSYDWSFQAEEEPTNYALMAFSSSSSSSDNE
nr:ribonuclease H-like domain-containing protein [Tanacetum cinerariifolium]